MERFFKIYLKYIRLILEFLFPPTKSEAYLSNISPSEFKDRFAKAENKNAEIRALFSYKEPVIRDLIWLIKYKKRDFAINLAAELLLDEIFEEESEKMTFSGNRKTLLIPIPISPTRMKERGYNQMNEVAKVVMSLGGRTCFEHENRILLKFKDTPGQTSIKNRKERLKNVIGCFSVPNKDLVRGRNILVIDDVTTTGATLNEAKKVLLKAGAKNVSLLAIAH